MMKNSFTLLIALVIVGFLLAYMFAFQVRYDEVVVLTTFDKAQEPARDEQGNILRDAAGRMENPGSVIEDAGLYFKWPWPIQKATAYSKRIQVLEDRLEQLPTADGFSIALQTYMTWRIEDPLAFFVKLKDNRAAERALDPLLGDVRALVSEYDFDQLVNTDASKLKLKEIEQRVKDGIAAKLASNGYGIRVEQVGIRRLVLPEGVSEKVFERMKAAQQRKAAEARASGEAEAGRIRSEARTAQDRILAQAERRGQSLRAQGDREAAEYFKVFRQNEELAKLIKRVDSLRSWLGNRTTLVLPAEEFGFDKLLSGDGGDVQPPLRPAAKEPEGSEVNITTPSGQDSEVRGQDPENDL